MSTETIELIKVFSYVITFIGGAYFSYRLHGHIAATIQDINVDAHKTQADITAAAIKLHLEKPSVIVTTSTAVPSVVPPTP